MIKRIASFISAIVLCILILPLELPEANAEMLTGYPRESDLSMRQAYTKMTPPLLKNLIH